MLKTLYTCNLSFYNKITWYFCTSWHVCKTVAVNILPYASVVSAACSLCGVYKLEKASELSVIWANFLR